MEMGTIRLRTVHPEDHDLLWNINQKYLYEMTNYYPDPMDEEGNYHYGYFEEYFSDPKRKAFFIYNGETMIGFAMLCPYSNIGQSPDYTMAEFTIFPSFRRNHYAYEAAKLLLSSYPGCWEIKYNEKNIGAKKLWTALTASYQPVLHHLNEEETVLEFSTLTRGMNRSIVAMQERYLVPALDLVEQVFSEWNNPDEGKMVRHLVEEIRSKKYYLPELELLMMNDRDEIIGYAMFSRFHIEGRYEDELLILTPVALRTDMQRQGISRELIEYGFKHARTMGYKAVLVEGDPKNYNPRGFETSAEHGIVAGPNIHLPHVSCLMVKELVPGALEGIHGVVDYSFYETLREE